MAKKYDLLSKSDMRKFQKDLENTVIKEAKSAALKGKYEALCPYCETEIAVRAGKNICPHCHKVIEFNIDFH